MRAWLVPAYMLVLLLGIGFSLIAHAVEKQSNVNLSTWVEVSAVACGKNCDWVLNVEGVATNPQTLKLMQEGMVFAEQSLSAGSFKLQSIKPLNSKQAVQIVLESPDKTADQTELPLRANEKRILFARISGGFSDNASVASTVNKVLKRSDIDEDLEFDADFLRGKAFRSLDSLAIKQLGRARPGSFDTSVYRNGLLIAKTPMLFIPDPLQPKGDAKACIPPSLFNQLGVKTSAMSNKGRELMATAEALKVKQSKPTSSDCLPIDEWVSDARSEFDPGELRLDISIAQAFVTNQNRQSVPKELLTRGENAGFVNYNLNSFNNGSLNSTYVNLKAGVNLGGWQFRQSSVYTQSSQTASQLVVSETVVKRPLLDWKANLAIGDTSTFSPVIGSTPLRGVRLSSEDGLYPDEERSYKPVVRGIARTNARVRILQNNTVFFEQNVPPGPFEFSDFNPLSTVGNLTVQVDEADGSVQTFIVPFSFSSGKLNPGAYRYSISSGLFRNYTGEQNKAVFQSYLRYGLNDYISPTAEVLLGPDYSNLGLQLNYGNELGNLSFNSLFSHLSGGTPSRGHAQSLNYQAPSWKSLNFSAGLNQQSLFYVTPTAALGNSVSTVVSDSFKYSNYLGVGLNMGEWGSLNVNSVRQTNWNQAEVSKQYRLGYNVNIYQVFLYANWDHIPSGNGQASSNSFSISASVPLSFGNNNGRLQASSSQFGNSTPSQNLSYSGSSKDNVVGYGLTHSQAGSTSSDSANVSLQHPWGYASGSFTTGSGIQQTGLSLGGGVVGHSGGVILSPTLGETFAIVEVANGQGASVAGSQSQVNAQGFAVVPYLSPYYLNDVQISLESASLDVDLENAVQKIAPVEGSIVRLKFNATSGRAVVATFSLPNGRKLPIGTSVVDDEGNELGLIGQGNRGLLRLQKDVGQLKLVWGDKPEDSCLAKYALEKKTAANDNSTGSSLIRLQLSCTNNGQALASTEGKP